jgi:cytochrome c553
MPVAEGGTEPLGNRIIETPTDPERFFLLDSQVTYFVYVPPGSIRRGRELVARGPHGKATACRSCHGADLRGMGAVPPIAGRSPSNIVRQLYDIKLGARSGPDVELMQPVVRDMSDADIVNIVAYLASRKP